MAMKIGLRGLGGAFIAFALVLVLLAVGSAKLGVDTASAQNCRGEACGKDNSPPPPAPANLAVSKSVGNGPFLAGANSGKNLYTFNISNSGGTAAAFSSNQVILVDSVIPELTSVSFTTPANVSCTLNPGGGYPSGTIVCKATGAVSIAPGGSIQIVVRNPVFTAFDGDTSWGDSATESAPNPAPGGLPCKVDPGTGTTASSVNSSNGVVSESNEANNLCNAAEATVRGGEFSLDKSLLGGDSDFSPGEVASDVWALDFMNNSGDVILHPGDVVLVDDLPNQLVNVVTGSPLFSGITDPDGATNGTGTVLCTVEDPNTGFGGDNVLTCEVITDEVVIGQGATIHIEIGATMPADMAGSTTNPDPAEGAICRADPDGQVPETNEGNNDCDPQTITISAPNLVVVSKTVTSPVAGSPPNPVAGGVAVTYVITLQNQANVAAVWAAGDVVFEDDFENELTGNASIALSGGASGQFTGDCSEVDTGHNVIKCVADGGESWGGGQTLILTITGYSTPTDDGRTYNNPAGDSSPSNCMVDVPDESSFVPVALVAQVGNILETNESDNTCPTTSFTVPDVDLVASLIILPGLTPGAGNPVLFNVSVSNVGGANAGAFTTTIQLPSNVNFGAIVDEDQGSPFFVEEGFTCSANGTPYQSSRLITCTRTGLLAGTSAVFHVFGIMNNASALGCTLVDADSVGEPWGQVVEYNEANNTANGGTTCP